jgi:hypothetical protein
MSDVEQVFFQFQKHAECILNSKLKAIQFDWGGGGIPTFESLLQSTCINHIISCSHTRQQNGLVERKHRHLVETSLSLIAQAPLPLKFWMRPLTQPSI